MDQTMHYRVPKGISMHTTSTATVKSSRRTSRVVLIAAGVAVIASLTASCAQLWPWRPSSTAFSSKDRVAVLQRAQVWAPTKISALH